MGTLLDEISSPEHWPLWVMAGVLWVCTHFLEMSVFTKYRAKHSSPEWFWYWAKEALEFFPLVAGSLWGAVLWPDPEGQGWGLAHNAGYGLGAGLLSMVAFLLLCKIMDRTGFARKFRLPGESNPPEK